MCGVECFGFLPFSVLQQYFEGNVKQIHLAECFYMHISAKVGFNDFED